MLVAVRTAPPPRAESGQKWPKMALHLTNFCDIAASHVLAHPVGLAGFAALSHPAGSAARCCRRAKSQGVGISFRRDSKSYRLSSVESFLALLAEAADREMGVYVTF